MSHEILWFPPSQHLPEWGVLPTACSQPEVPPLPRWILLPSYILRCTYQNFLRTSTFKQISILSKGKTTPFTLFPIFSVIMSNKFCYCWFPGCNLRLNLQATRFLCFLLQLSSVSLSPPTHRRFWIISPELFLPALIRSPLLIPLFILPWRYFITWKNLALCTNLEISHGISYLHTLKKNVKQV